MSNIESKMNWQVKQYMDGTIQYEVHDTGERYGTVCVPTGGGKTLSSLRYSLEHAKKYHKDVTYCGEFDEAAKTAFKMLSEPSGSDYPDGYIFVTMGAGNNWQVGTKVLRMLETKN